MFQVVLVGRVFAPVRLDVEDLDQVQGVRIGRARDKDAVVFVVGDEFGRHERFVDGFDTPIIPLNDARFGRIADDSRQLLLDLDWLVRHVLLEVNEAAQELPLGCLFRALFPCGVGPVGEMLLDDGVDLEGPVMHGDVFAFANPHDIGEERADGVDDRFPISASDGEPEIVLKRIDFSACGRNEVGDRSIWKHAILLEKVLGPKKTQPGLYVGQNAL